MFGLRKLEICVRVKNSEQVKVRGVLGQYVYKNNITTRPSDGSHVCLLVTILAKHEKDLYHDIEVMKMLGIDVRG